VGERVPTRDLILAIPIRIRFEEITEAIALLQAENKVQCKGGDLVLVGRRGQ
jgi:hypothetical protein